MPGALKGARYRFGVFELSTGEESLSRNGTRVKIQDLPYRLLAMLVERPGEIVTRDEVRQCLWPENTFVEFDNSLGVAIRKIRDALNDDAEAPRYVETVPRRGYRFVAPVTVLEPDQSPETHQQTESPTTASLTKDSVVSDRIGVAETARLHTPRKRWLLGALALLLVGGGIYGFRSGFRSVARHSGNGAEASGRVPTPTRVRRSVAVLGFRNLPGRSEDNWLSLAFAEMLNTELSADGALRMVPGEDIARVKRELPLADEDSLSRGTLEHLRTNPGADVVVLGSYTAISGNGDKRIRLDVRVQDTARGETIAERSFTGNEANLFELAAQAGEALRQTLGVHSQSVEGGFQVRAALPSNQEAIRFYTEGQDRLWAFDFIHARELLLKAIAADPAYPLAHAALSDTWNHLGYTPKARDEIERARALSEHLGAEERLLIDGQYYSLKQDRVQAIDAYRKLFVQFPDNLNYGLRLAEEQRWVNPEDALRTLEALRHLPSSSGDDPRIDMREAQVWIDKDFVKAQGAARRAVEKGTVQGSPLIVGRAYGILCQMLGNGASMAQTIQDCEKARQSAAAAGERDGGARNENDLAGLYYQLGDLDRAETMFREAMAVFRQYGDIEGVTIVSSNLGDIFLARGNLPAATRALSDAIPGYREMGDKDGVALALNDLAEVARRRGDLEAALSTYQEAKATAKEIDDKRAIGYVLTGIGDVFVDRGDLEAARNSYEESLALRKQTGEKQNVAETELALARVSSEEGHGANAESVIRKCKEQFQRDHEADDEITASIVLIDVLLAQGKYEDGAKEAVAEKAMADKTANQLIRLMFDLASIRADLASHHIEPAQARAQLESTLQSAHAHRLLGVELEIRLALAEVRRKLGQSAAAQADLFALEKAARGKGFGLIAAKARQVDGHSYLHE